MRHWTELVHRKLSGSETAQPSQRCFAEQKGEATKTDGSAMFCNCGRRKHAFHGCMRSPALVSAQSKRSAGHFWDPCSIKNSCLHENVDVTLIAPLPTPAILHKPIR